MGRGLGEDVRKGIISCRALRRRELDPLAEERATFHIVHEQTLAFDELPALVQVEELDSDLVSFSGSNASRVEIEVQAKGLGFPEYATTSFRVGTRGHLGDVRLAIDPPARKDTPVEQRLDQLFA